MSKTLVEIDVPPPVQPPASVRVIDVQAAGCNNHGCQECAAKNKEQNDAQIEGLDGVEDKDSVAEAMDEVYDEAASPEDEIEDRAA